MRYLHTMVRVRDLDESLDFYCGKLGLIETRRIENEKGRFTLVFLAAKDDIDAAPDRAAPLIELTYNWDTENYAGGRNFGHLAYQVDNIYKLLRRPYGGGNCHQPPAPRRPHGLYPFARWDFIRTPAEGTVTGAGRAMGQYGEYGGLVKAEMPGQSGEAFH